MRGEGAPGRGSRSGGPLAVGLLVTLALAIPGRGGRKLPSNEGRERILQLVQANPGLNLSSVRKLAGLGWGVTVYHVATLERNGLIASRTSGRDRCFFPADRDFNGLSEALMAVTNRKPVRAIAAALVCTPWMSQTRVVERSGYAQRIVSYHLAKLVAADLVERRQDGPVVRYRARPGLVAALDVSQRRGEAPPMAVGNRAMQAEGQA